jgi:hypothetical protein
MKAQPAILTVFLLTCIGTPSAAQVLSGRVLESSSGRPVGDALVSLVASSRVVSTVESDVVGRFRLQAPAPGWYSLRVQRIGYAPVSTDSVTVAAGENVDVVLRLWVSAVALTPLIVERRAPDRARSQLERRIETGRQMGLGWFITREALDSIGSRSVTGILLRVPRVSVAVDSLNRTWPITQSQGGCRPTLYLNGARMAFAAGQALDDVLVPGDLEAIEVYRTRNELPHEFAGIDQCAAIVFWTRFGGSDATGPWRYIAMAGAVFGLIGFLLVQWTISP